MKSGTFTNNTSFTATAAQVDVPTGEHRITTQWVSHDQFTVPNGITVVMVSSTITSDVKRYIGVTPGKTYELTITAKPPDFPPAPGILLVKLSHDHIIWYYASAGSTNFIISWSPEINNMTPTITDY